MLGRRIPVYATLLLAAFLVGRWSVGNQWITQTLQPVAAGLVESTAEAADLPAELDLRTVTRVIDGDTLVLDGDERVRLIGVDTPETVHPSRPVEYFGREASAFTKRMAEGQQVYLEYEYPPTGPLRAHSRVCLPAGRHAAQQGDHRAGLRTRLHAVPVLEDGGVPRGTASGTSCGAGAVA